MLDLVHREHPIPDNLKSRLSFLADQGVIERVSKGKYILSHRFYSFLGKKGVYTRKRGLDRETNKALLLKHINDNKREGSQLHELMQVLPFLSRNQIQRLLRELRSEGKIYNKGVTSTARWY